MKTHSVSIEASGHENVSGEHQSTFELTTDEYLTPAGDCILGIEADTAPNAFPDEFVSACQHEDAILTIAIETPSHEAELTASGHPDLSFESTRSLVVRTSEYIDDRTIAIGASKAASDIDRDLIDELASGADVSMTIRVERS